jgi:response regulator RpfG family c-di-GMP phosphodiesterase
VSERILCVDDDPVVLQAYQRALRKRFHIEPAFGGEEALRAIAEQGPYAVVVSDMRMPGMNGVELLVRISEIAPNTVRMMLTGNVDQETALEAVNQGHIFRFMTKPCPTDVFASALDAGLAQYRLVTAERDLLSKTLSGSVKVLTDVLGLANPAAFGRAARVHRLVHDLCARLRIGAAWQVEIAAMLSQIGCVAVPEETLCKIYEGKRLSQTEADSFAAHPTTGYELLRNIPRLEEVADIVAYQEKRFNGQGYPVDRRCGEAIPLGSRILKVALDFDTLTAGGTSEEMAIAEINGRRHWYDPVVVAALRDVLAIETMQVVRRLQISELPDRAILAEDVMSPRGMLLCAKGQEVNSSLRARLKNYVLNLGLQGPIKVFLSPELAEHACRTAES